MTKLLRLPAVLVLAVTAFAARPAAAFVPLCYSNLPHHSSPDPSWTYSHQCREGSTTWYVYIDALGKWHLVGSTILP
jgi:hypothetical protein